MMTTQQTEKFDAATRLLRQYVEYLRGTIASLECSCTCSGDDVVEILQTTMDKADSTLKNYTGHLRIDMIAAVGSYLRGVLAVSSDIEDYPTLEKDLAGWVECLTTFDEKKAPAKTYGEAFYIDYTGQLRNINDFVFPKVVIVNPDIDKCEKQKVILSKT